MRKLKERNDLTSGVVPGAELSVMERSNLKLKPYI
jgi:hypothetical protein